MSGVVFDDELTTESMYNDEINSKLKTLIVSSKSKSYSHYPYSCPEELPYMKFYDMKYLPSLFMTDMVVNGRLWIHESYKHSNKIERGPSELDNVIFYNGFI